MAKLYYLEIEETVADPMEQLPEFLRIQVADEAEAISKLAENEKLFAGKSYVAKFHTHTHSAEVGENIPCVSKELKKV